MPEAGKGVSQAATQQAHHEESKKDDASKLPSSRVGDTHVSSSSGILGKVDTFADEEKSKGFGASVADKIKAKWNTRQKRRELLLWCVISGRSPTIALHPALDISDRNAQDLPTRIGLERIQMSVDYVPDSLAPMRSPYNITFLSQRDVAAQIPLNFVTVPSVSTSAACFNHGRYEAGSIVRCISNLLAAGYGRLVSDIYWDASRRVWTFCPTQIPQSSQGLNGGRLVDLNATIFPSAGPARTETLYQLGPYLCSSEDNLSLLPGLLQSLLKNSDDTLQASLKYIILNIHAASPLGQPLGPSQMPSQDALPGPAEQLSTIFSSQLSNYTYTPAELGAERAALHTSWNSSYVQALLNPDEFYFHLDRHPDGTASSPDGWPGESYMILQDKKRLLVGTGTVDPQMSSYNIQADGSTIFIGGLLDQFVNVTVTPNGTVTDGCFYEPGKDRIDNVNASWAIVDREYEPSSFFGASSGDTIYSLQATHNLTSCGISGFLNASLDNSTAGENIQPYQQYALRTVWSWAQGEPRNDSDATNAPASSNSSQADTSQDMSNFRCAVADASTSGRWYVTFCDEQFPVACRDPNDPFSWYISSTSSYLDAHRHCRDDDTFGVPRTALENRYLLEATRDHIAHNGSAGSFVWINYNSRAAESCWVPGANTSCPYMVEMQQNDASIIVPTIAAIIIILIALATLLVKCGANRSSSRKRRKFYDGWDYEGVPS